MENSALSFRSLRWISQPLRYIQDEDRLVIETEPFTDLNKGESSAEAVELSCSTKGSFIFTVRVDFNFHDTFDQCGIVIYNGTFRNAVCGMACHDAETARMMSTVYHVDGADRAGLDIGEAIHWMYYRVFYRAGQVKIQYSFNGDRWTDLRTFGMLRGPERVGIGLYACSPGDSSFDCTFSDMTLMEEETV